MGFLRILVCAVLAMVVVLGVTMFLISIFDQEEYAIQVIPMDTVSPEEKY